MRINQQTSREMARERGGNIRIMKKNMTNRMFLSTCAAFVFSAVCLCGGDGPTLPLPGSRGATSPDIMDGFHQYASFDYSIRTLLPPGGEFVPAFLRDSEAWTPALEKAEYMAPRFMAGKYGQGILLEYGWCTVDRNAGRNLLESRPFHPAGGSVLDAIEGPGGTPGVHIVGNPPGFSVGPVSVPAKSKTVSTLCFSVYLKGQKDQDITVVAEQQSLDVRLTDDWQRVELLCPAFEMQTNLNIQVAAKGPGAFFAAAPMLEVPGNHYTVKSTASTWMPPYRKRPGELVKFPAPEDPEAGTVAFWFRLLGKNSWRRLISFDHSDGWRPLVAVDIAGENMVRFGKQRIPLPRPLDDGEWHHVSLRWEAGYAEVFVDGINYGGCSISPPAAPLYLGCSPNSLSPGLRADAVFDELAIWTRPLSDGEISGLYGRSTALSEGLQRPLRIHDAEPVSVFCRDPFRRRWKLELVNEDARDLTDVTVVWGVGDLFRKQRVVERLGGMSRMPMELDWDPFLLLPGKYRFFVEVGELRYQRNIEIVPARVPRENVQVRLSEGGTRELQALGVTMGEVHRAINAVEIEKANRCGLYSLVRLFIQGEAGSRKDFMLDIAGNPHHVDQRAPAPMASFVERAEKLGERLSYFPDIREVVMNTEGIWVWGLDFRPATMEMAKTRFGLDLYKWFERPEKDRLRAVPPFGRLAPSMGGIPPPVDGIVPLNDPLYAFMRWWHSDQAGNEVFLNDRVATIIRRHAPWIKTIGEPALRRPAVRAFKAQDILDEWFYYENPLIAISTQEKLAAAARGTGTRIAGQPQFLFKAGKAAPFKAMPTPHLFREAMWLCLSRPLYRFDLWGMQKALHPEKGALAQEALNAELDRRLEGKERNYENVKAVVSTRGEHSDISLFIPELRAEIGRMLNEVVHPLGALLPVWRNRTRKMALYISFAGQLHSETRWLQTPPFMEALPYPYDVLYDQDFEDNPDVLKDYQVVFLHECAAVTAAAAPQLERFGRRGGLFLADGRYRGGLDNVVVIEDGGMTPAVEARMRDKHFELLHLYGDIRHPQYIEGMEQIAAELRIDPAPFDSVLTQVEARLKPEISVANRHVRLNLLEASGASYLVAVNDLRTTGEHFGAYHRVLEKGLPLNGVRFGMHLPLGNVAYELLRCQEVSVRNAEFYLDLPPAGGAIVIFLPERLTTLRLVMPPRISQGEVAAIHAELRGESGQSAPGIIPCKLDIIRPDGSVDSLSHHGAIKKGTFAFELPIPLNAPAGVWHVTIRELASGMTARGSIEVD